MKIGKNILNKPSNAVSPPKKQECRQLEKLEQGKKKRTEDTEENIKYTMPDKEGDASAQDLAKQTEELTKEKHAFDARHDIPIDDIESE